MNAVGNLPNFENDPATVLVISFGIHARKLTTKRLKILVQDRKVTEDSDPSPLEKATYPLALLTSRRESVCALAASKWVRPVDLQRPLVRIGNLWVLSA